MSIRRPRRNRAVVRCTQIRDNSSSCGEEEFLPRPGSRRKSRKHCSSRTHTSSAHRNEAKDERGSPVSIIRKHGANVHSLEANNDCHHHKRKNVNIRVKALSQHDIQRKIQSEICHKGIEVRGYRPVNEADPCSRYNTDSCGTSREKSTCREHIYRPVKSKEEQNCEDVEDGFVSGIEGRCEEDRKFVDCSDYAKSGNTDKPCSHRDNINTRMYRPKPPEKHHKEQQTTECSKSTQQKNYIHSHQIKVVSKLDNNGGYILLGKKVGESYGEPIDHLFPFEKTQHGLLKINPSMIYYRSEKLCLLVSNHLNTRIQIKSTPLCINTTKSDDNGENLDEFVKTLEITKPQPNIQVEIPERDCGNHGETLHGGTNKDTTSLKRKCFKNIPHCCSVCGCLLKINTVHCSSGYEEYKPEG